jgi:hypothetical protein
VTRTLIEAWIDADKMVDLETTGKISMRLGEIEESEPFGIATYKRAPRCAASRFGGFRRPNEPNDAMTTARERLWAHGRSCHDWCYGQDEILPEVS